MQTGDRVPSEAEGTALAQQATARYLARLDRRPNVRSAFSEDRGYLEKPSAGATEPISDQLEPNRGFRVGALLREAWSSAGSETGVRTVLAQLN